MDRPPHCSRDTQLARAARRTLRLYPQVHLNRAAQSCFIAWTSALTGVAGDVIAVDGKTLRRSYQEGGAKAPIHMISAWSSRQRIVLGQAKVASKSNEISALPG